MTGSPWFAGNHENNAPETLESFIKYYPGKRSLLTLIVVFFCLFPLLSYSITTPLNLRRACKAANDSDIILKWNIPSDACNSFISYDLYARKDNSSAFVLIDSVKTLSQNQYIHKGAFLQANTWQYFVIVRFDCNGSPTLSSDTLNIDLTQPFDQLIDSVSVDPVSGKYIIGWKKNSSFDLAGYKLYQVVGNNNFEITDLINTTNQYTDAQSNPGVTTKVYSIAAYDSCNNITAIIDKHEAIKLSVSFDSCSRSFALSWSPYKGMSILKYRILLSVNGSGFTGIKDIAGTGTAFNYYDPSIADGDQVCFAIRGIKAIDTSITSTSNSICLLAKFISTASVNYISSVSVIDHSHLNIDWLTDNSSLVSVLVLSESTDGLNFITRRMIKPLSNTISFTLDSVNTDSIIYFYRVSIYNSCMKFQGTSNLCNTILLSASKINAGSNITNWNNYQSFNAGVFEYEISHGTGDIIQGYTFTKAGATDSSKTTYTDDILPSEISNDGVCYYVVAIENPGNAYGVQNAQSKSNRVCVNGDMLAFYPNIFRPNSPYEQNKIFRPRGVFIDYKKSSLTIFDRWGNLVFETNDLSIGWNGMGKDGNILADNTFIYYSLVTPIKGKPIEFKGIVHLER